MHSVYLKSLMGYQNFMLNLTVGIWHIDPKTRLEVRIACCSNIVIIINYFVHYENRRRTILHLFSVV